MPLSAARMTLRVLAHRPHRQRDGSWSARSFSLLLIRRQAQAGLLRDGGLTPADVSRYVRRLRHDAEEEIALLSQSHDALATAAPAHPSALLSGRSA